MIKILLNIIICLVSLIFYKDIKTDCSIVSCVSCDTKCDNNQKFKHNGNIFGKTFFSMRPQDSNTVRRIIGSQYRNEFFPDRIHTIADVVFEYQETFKESKSDLGTWFAFNGCNCMSIGVPTGHNNFDINAIQFGLLSTVSTGDLGLFCIKPKIKNFITDLNFRFDLNKCACGWWINLDFIVVRAENSLNLQAQTSMISTSTFFGAGYFSTDCNTITTIPYCSVSQALKGDIGFGDVPELKYGKFPSCKLKKTGLSAIQLDLGYDIVRSDCGFFGIGAYTSIPTGNRPNSKFLLEPIIGANKSWQLGAEIVGLYTLESSCNKSVMFSMDAIITHLFKSCQRRLFSLKNNGPGSQYLLLKKFNPIGSVIGAERVANILAGETKIGADIMFDGSVMLQINACNFFTSVGYNLWLRTKEKRSKNVCLPNFKEDTYGIKGDFPLSFCQTISACTCTGQCVCRCSTFSVSNTITASSSTISIPGIADAQTTFIGVSDIDFSTPLHPFAMSHKVFGTIGLNFDSCKYPFYFLVGGEVEFSGTHNKALNQFGILFKTGVSF